MKISNSKRQLAQIIRENGGWRCDAMWAAQDRNATVTFFLDEPLRCENPWEASSFGPVGGFRPEGKAVPNWHQTVLSREEFDQIVAETVVSSEQDADGWIEWNGGGACPVDDGALIDVTFRDGTVQTACKARLDKSEGHRYWTCIWSHAGHKSDIIAYRLHKPEQDEAPTEGESPEQRARLASIYAPTLDQLLQDWRNADDYAQRKQTEADEAAAMRDEWWKAVQARAGEMGVTVGRCESATADSELELVITDWRDVRCGDYVWVGDSGNCRNCPLGEYEVVAIDARDNDKPFGIKWNDRVTWPQIHKRGWRFIRRP